MLVFSLWGKKILAVPSTPRSLCWQALDRYQAFTLKRRFYVWAARLSLAARCERLLAKRRRFPESDELPFDYHGLVAQVRRQLNLKDGHSFAVWPSQPDRERFYVHLVDEQLNPVAFVKIAISENRTCLDREADALGELASRQFDKIRVPRLLDKGTFGSTNYLVMEPLPSSASYATLTRSDDIRPWIAEIGTGRHLADEGQVRNTPWWHRYESRLGTSHQSFHSELCERLVNGAELTRVHGDMGLANIVMHQNRMWIFDWESTDAAAPVQTDEVAWFLSFSVGEFEKRPTACMRDLRRRYLEDAGDEQRLNVMLAIAYRHSVDVPDAEFYMEHWSSVGRV